VTACTFELVAGPFDDPGEGVRWDGRFIYFALIGRGEIMRFDPDSGACDVWRSFPNAPNGLSIDAQGRIYACAMRSRSVVRFEADGGMTVIATTCDGKPLNTPSDMDIDSRGRIWFSNAWIPQFVDTTEMMAMSPGVIRLDPLADGSWTATEVVSGLLRPNGVAVSHDQRTLYVSEQPYGPDEPRELRAYPIHDDGSLGQHVVLCAFGYDHRGAHRAVDGLCLDQDGSIWATAGYEQSGPGPMIMVFSPQGRVLETHPTPYDMPTNCTFGDRDLRSLYVTTAKGHLLRARISQAQPPRS